MKPVYGRASFKQRVPATFSNTVPAMTALISCDLPARLQPECSHLLRLSSIGCFTRQCVTSGVCVCTHACVCTRSGDTCACAYMWYGGIVVVACACVCMCVCVCVCVWCVCGGDMNGQTHATPMLLLVQELLHGTTNTTSHV